MLPAARRNGVARALLSAAADFARADGALPVLFVLCRVFHVCAAPQRTPICLIRETQGLGLLHDSNHKM